MDKWEYQNKMCYLENRVVREPYKQGTACIRKLAKIKDHVRTIANKILGKYKDQYY